MGLQTLYSVADMIVGFTANMLDKEYPQGALLLDDKKAEQLATSMAQMNLTSPKLANTINKYSAPTIFATTLLADVALKGMIVYGTFKQPSRTEQQKRVAQTDPSNQPTHYQ